MITTTQFFIWFFKGLGGIGGWLIFFLVSAAAVLVIFVDSINRKLPALGWRLASILTFLLVFPAGIYRFLPAETQATLLQYLELMFYLGIIGGIVPFFVALGYLLHFRGFAVCPHGHIYEPALGECYQCLRDRPEQAPPQILVEGENWGGATQVPEVREEIQTQVGRVILPIKSKEKAQAFLLLADGHTYQVNKGISMIGRNNSNDFVFLNNYVGKMHAKIIQEGKNLFRLYDLGSRNGTWVNDRKLKQPLLLESDDEIRFGQEVKVTFLVSSNR